MLETISFCQNIYICIFNFFLFLSLKSYQFYKIYQDFDRTREKTLIQRSMRKKKLRKVRLCIITGCFLKSFKMIINPIFCSSSLFLAPFPLFDIINIKRANWERQ